MVPWISLSHGSQFRGETQDSRCCGSPPPRCAEIYSYYKNGVRVTIVAEKKNTCLVIQSTSNIHILLPKQTSNLKIRSLVFRISIIQITLITLLWTNSFILHHVFLLFFFLLNLPFVCFLLSFEEADIPRGFAIINQTCAHAPPRADPIYRRPINRHKTISHFTLLASYQCPH